MIALLNGVVIEKRLDYVIVDVGGVGYQVFCTMICSQNLHEGDTARIIIHTDVKEDSIRLFGFADFLEKQIFLLLTAVKGVGAKSGLEILSRVDCRALLRIIGSSDIVSLTKVKGIGKKTAERIIVELKDKVGDYAGGLTPKIEKIHYDAQSTATVDAVSALKALGFQSAEAEKAVGSATTKYRLDKNLSVDAPLEQFSVEDIVREALRYV